MASAYDDFVAQQAYDSMGSYAPSYSVYEPSYDAYSGYDPAYSSAGYGSYATEPAYDYGYSQPSYDYNSGYDTGYYGAAYEPAPAYDYGYQEPNYTYQTVYQPTDYSGYDTGVGTNYAYQQPNYRQQSTPDLSYTAPDPYRDPGYTLDQGYRPEYQQPSAPIAVDEYTAYTTPPVATPGRPDTAWLAPQVDPSRNPTMPAPYVAPEPVFSPGVALANNYEAQQYQAGNVYSTGPDQGGLWNSYRTNDPAAEMDQVQQERATQIQQAEETETNLNRLREQEQMQTARYRAGLGPPTEEGMGATFVPEPTGPVPWLGDRASDLGARANQIRQTPPAQLAGDALGAVGDTVYAGFDRLRDNAQRQGATNAVTQAGMVNPLAGVDENTPFFGGVAQGFDQLGTNISNAENLQEILGAPLSSISVPQDWFQRWQAEGANAIATGQQPWYETPARIGSQLLRDRPVVGELMESPLNMAANATEEERAIIAQVHANAEAQQPGTGDRAVWEYYQSDRNVAQRAFADLASDPTGWALGGVRTGSSIGAGLARAAKTSSNPVVRTAGRAGEPAFNALGTIAGSAEAAADLGATNAFGWAGSRLRSSPLGKPFQLTPAAELQQQVNTAATGTSDLLTSFRSAGSPGAPPDTTSVFTTNGGGNGLGFDPSQWTNANTTRERKGEFIVNQRGDTGEVILTRAENSEIVTPTPLTMEQAEAVIAERQAGAPLAEAVAVGDRMRTGWNAPESQPIGRPPRMSDQPEPNSRVAFPIEETGDDIVLVSDYTGNYWLENPDTGGILYGPMSITDAYAQANNAADIVRLDRSERATQAVTQPPVTGGLPPSSVPNAAPLRENADALSETLRAAQTGQTVTPPVATSPGTLPAPPMSRLGEVPTQQVATSPGTIPPPTQINPTAVPAVPRKATQGRHAGRFVLDEGTPNERIVSPVDFDAAYQQMQTMTPKEYLGPEAAQWRHAMYGVTTRDGGQYLRKNPAIQPAVEQQADGSFRVIDARTNRPLGKYQGVGSAYPTEQQAQRAVDQIQGRVQEQTAAHDRYLNLQAARMQVDPVGVEQGLRNPTMTDAVPEPIVREVKRRAGVPENGLPPAPNGHAVDVMTGERVIAQPEVQPWEVPSLNVADHEAAQIRGPFLHPDFRNREAFQVTDRYAVVKQRVDRRTIKPEWEVYERQPAGATRPWKPVATVATHAEGIGYAQDIIRRGQAGEPNGNPANRLGIATASPAEAARSGFTQGQRLRDAMARPSFVQRTAGQAPEPMADSRFADIPMTPENMALVETPMPLTKGPDRTFADAFFDEIDEMSEAVGLAQMRDRLNPTQTKRLESLAKKYGVTSTDELANLDEATQDLIIQDRLIADYRTELLAGGKDPALAANKVSGLYTDAKNLFRTTALYNILNVPRQFLANFLGNPLPAVLFKPSMFLGRGGYADPRNWDRVMRQTYNEIKGGKQWESGYEHVMKSYGLAPHPDVVSSTSFNEKLQMGTGSGLWGRDAAPRSFKRALSRINSETGFLLVKGLDSGNRQAAGFAPIRENAQRMVREIRTHAKDTAQKFGVLVSDAQIDTAIDELVERAIRDKDNLGIPAFSAADLKASLGSLPTNAGPSPATWADRVHRDWQQGVSALRGETATSANKWAGNFSQMKIDEFVGNIAKFHVWASRMSALYVTEAMRNPHILVGYMNAIDGLEKMAEEENYPDSVKGFFQLFKSPAGISGYVDPRFFIPGFLVGAEQVYQETGEYGLTKLGEGIQWLQEHGFPLIETLRAPLYFSGAEGGGNLLPDPTYGIRDSLGAIANLINSAGVLGKIGLEQFQQAGVLDADIREISNATAHAISGWFVNGPLNLSDRGFKQVPLESAEYLRGDHEISQIVSDIIERDGLASTPEEHEQMILDAMADPSGDIYQEAYTTWSTQVDAVKAGNRLANPLPMRIRNEAADERARIISGETDATPAEIEAAKTIRDATRSASPEDAALSTALDEYYAAEDHFGQAVADSYFRIKNAEIPGTFRVNGREYTQWDIEAMDKSERHVLAEEWLQGITAESGEDARLRMETRFDAQNAILAENPDLAGAVEFKARAREYGPGIDAFIEETARINPSYAGYLSTIDDPVGSEGYRERATSYTAAQIAQGIPTDIFNPLQQDEGRGRVAGLPEETTLAEAQSIRQAEREEEQAAQQAEYEEGQAQWRGYVEDTASALMYYNERLTERADVLRQAGVSEADIDLYFGSVANEWEGRLPSHIYYPLRDAFGSENVYPDYPKDADGSSNGGAYDYWVARRQDPTLVLEDFLSERSKANREEREAFTPETDLAGVPTYTGTPLEEPEAPNNGLRTWGEVSDQTSVDPFLASVGESFKLPVSQNSVAVPGDANAMPTDGSTASFIVAEAQRLVGSDWILGAKGEDWNGDGAPDFDCSGLIYHIAKQQGIDIPNRTYEQWGEEWTGSPGAGRLVGADEPLAAGDLVFFDTGDFGEAAGLFPYDGQPHAEHVGIYIGDGMMIHGPNPEAGVILSPLADYQSQYIGARRVFAP